MSELKMLARAVAEAGKYRSAQVRYRKKLRREQKAAKRREEDREFQRRIEERRLYRNLTNVEAPMSFRAFAGLELPSGSDE
jgi:hypothetical protein